MGCELTDVHNVIQYSQKPFFKPYITHCINQRKRHHDSHVMKNLYKLLANALYGKTIQSDRKYNTFNKIVHKDHLNKDIADPKFKSATLVGKDAYHVKKNKSQITLSSPIYIGAIVLQKAKLKNFVFHYNVAKPSGSEFPLDQIICLDEDRPYIMKSREYIKSVDLVYCDTDSLAYEITMNEKCKGYSLDFIYTHLFPSRYMDRSNFVSLSKDGNYEAGDLGLLKSEISDNVVEEGIFLAPKVYSIMSHPIDLDNTLSKKLDSSKTKVKRAVRGCPNKIVAKQFPHNQFYRILHGEKCPNVHSYHIAYNRKFRTMVTEKRTKIPLALYDNKRYWTDVNTSFGYNHPISIVNGYVTGDILTSKGGFIMETREIIEKGKKESSTDNMTGEEFDEYWYYEDLSDEDNNLDILVDLIKFNEEMTVDNDDILLNEDHDEFDDMEYTENGHVLYVSEQTDESDDKKDEDNYTIVTDSNISIFINEPISSQHNSCSTLFQVRNRNRKRKHNDVFTLSLNTNKNLKNIYKSPKNLCKYICIMLVAKSSINMLYLIFVFFTLLFFVIIINMLYLIYRNRKRKHNDVFTLSLNTNKKN